MAINRVQAEKLCSGPELRLFAASLRDRIKAHNKRELNQFITRTRKLRDKYQDLFRRQRLDTRKRTGTKGGPNKNSNQRTDQKATLFEEVLRRFEDRLAALEKKAQQETMRLAKAISATPAKTKTPAKPKAQPAAKKAAAKPKAKPAAKKAAAKPKAKSAVKKAVAKPKAKPAAKKAAAKSKTTAKVAAKVKSKVKAKLKAKLGTAKPATAKAETILTPGKAKKSSSKAKAKSKRTYMSKSASREAQAQDLQKTRGMAIQGHVRARGQRKQAKRDKR